MRSKRADPAVAVPQAGPPESDRPRNSLAFQVVLLVVGVALAVAITAGVIGATLLRTTAQDVARKYVSSQADVVAGALNGEDPGSRLGFARLADIFRQQNIAVITINAAGQVTGKDAVSARAATQAGLTQLSGVEPTKSQVVTVAANKYLVEARYAGGRAFALVSRVDNSAINGGSFQRRILLALVIGLAVAVVGGLVVARLMSRPLRHTAEVARAMGAGARDLRAQPGGPQEVADVADAVNELADALQHSEARQRQFLTSISHELRTPLTAIAGQAEALSDGIVASHEITQVGATIAAESARLQRLVSDLLDLARLGADQFRLDLAPCDLTGLLTDMAATWRVRCDQRGAVLRIERPDGPVVVLTDQRRLRQVLDGLAENALRLLKPGQPLVLLLAPTPAGVQLQVRDGGPGLAEEDYPVAFDQGVLYARYRATRPVGAGIGLPLVHSLITRMGGRIWAGPAPEGGVAMTIDLPTRPARPE